MIKVQQFKEELMRDRLFSVFSCFFCRTAYHLILERKYHGSISGSPAHWQEKERTARKRDIKIEHVCGRMKKGLGERNRDTERKRDDKKIHCET